MQLFKIVVVLIGKIQRVKKACRLSARGDWTFMLRVHVLYEPVFCTAIIIPLVQKKSDTTVKLHD